MLQGAYNVYRSRATLAWNLNCAAARMSQALGFHKAYLQDPEHVVPTRRKARLFVLIYISDKMLSLRLGRASMIRDEELPLDLRTLLNGVNTAPFKFPFQWLAFSRAQGLVYDQLYSPRALQQPLEVKQSIARALLEEVDQLMADECEIKVRGLRSRHLWQRSQSNPSLG